MIKVVHKNKSKYDTYIGRGSKWGNPFIIGKHGNREEVVLKYTKYILANDSLLNSLHELDHKILGCYCSPKLCHGDILKYLRNQQMENI